MAKPPRPALTKFKTTSGRSAETCKAFLDKSLHKPGRLRGSVLSLMTARSWGSCWFQGEESTAVQGLAALSPERQRGPWALQPLLWVTRECCRCVP